MNSREAVRRVGPVAWLLVWPIRAYQTCISRFTPATCRYYPCCSSYGITALRTHGAGKGLLLTAWRLLRCNPWTTGGLDHVPSYGRWRIDEASAEGTNGVMAVWPETSYAGRADEPARTIAAARAVGASTSRRTAA